VTGAPHPPPRGAQGRPGRTGRAGIVAGPS